MQGSRGSVRLVLSTYRTALRVPGAARFSATGFVARMPVAMIGLGIVLLVSERTGSYAAAGVLSAAFQLPAALGAVATSRWADRLGQNRLLPWLAQIHALFLLGFVFAVEQGWTLVMQGVVLAIAGVAQPAIGAMVRARWAFVSPDARVLRSAFAWESVVDELVFSIGPPITALIAFNVGLPLPLVLAAALVMIGGLALALQRHTQPTPRHAHPVPQAQESADAMGPRPSAAGLPLVVAAALGIGSVFGSYEVSVVAFTQQAGSPGASGLVLGLWAFGSMLGGIWFGSRHWSMTLGRQMLLLPALLTIALLPALVAPTVAILAVATALGGVAIAPSLIASFSLTERLVPSHRLTEGLTWTNSGLAVGFSAGTSLAGLLVDSYGTTAGFSLSVAGALWAAIIGALSQRRFASAAHSPEPEGPPTSWVDGPLPGPHPGGVADGTR